jgi:hypothetical protein
MVNRIVVIFWQPHSLLYGAITYVRIFLLCFSSLLDGFLNNSVMRGFGTTVENNEREKQVFLCFFFFLTPSPGRKQANKQASFGRNARLCLVAQRIGSQAGTKLKRGESRRRVKRVNSSQGQRLGEMRKITSAKGKQKKNEDQQK